MFGLLEALLLHRCARIPPRSYARGTFFVTVHRAQLRRVRAPMWLRFHRNQFAVEHLQIFLCKML
uniref:Secreted protein n=1 Tax=Ascaris lumbricoides TaxID=6252 RepID=A0A0M3IMY8_ASCLU